MTQNIVPSPCPNHHLTQEFIKNGLSQKNHNNSKLYPEQLSYAIYSNNLTWQHTIINKSLATTFFKNRIWPLLSKTPHNIKNLIWIYKALAMRQIGINYHKAFYRRFRGCSVASGGLGFKYRVGAEQTEGGKGVVALCHVNKVQPWPLGFLDLLAIRSNRGFWSFN